MGMADPWGTGEGASIESSCSAAQVETNQLSFDDNFSSKAFQKLPDSSEYVSVLERKLARIQCRSSGAASNPNREIVRGLSALRADRMRDFLGPAPVSLSPIVTSSDAISGGESGDNEIPDNNDPVYASWMMQRLFPDRQALSAEELAELLRFDTLALQHERSVQEVENTTTTAADQSTLEDTDNPHNVS
ncbi:uncharacterized protein LOC129600171 [Paramacrobiotus metropolitanus]|uniref:uncharacterized protein LOC129600171 n=1 Tax=Paramacrobiotus metropolitanus TaxID=2943436 RepID=UPI0024461A1A|nr:uncharacterized protein LOC129600171 [Paramacrobiotus metropolitanus]